MGSCRGVEDKFSWVSRYPLSSKSIVHGLAGLVNYDEVCKILMLGVGEGLIICKFVGLVGIMHGLGFLFSKFISENINL